MGTFSNEFVTKIYNLPKSKEAVSEFLNSYYDEVQPNGSVRRRQMWERFEGAYVQVTHHYDTYSDDNEADIYLLAHKLVSRCVLAEVAPYFESDGQLFSYFKSMVLSNRINNANKAKKQSLVLLGDLLPEGAADSDYSNFEETIFGSAPIDQANADSMEVVLSLVDSLSDPDLVKLGHLFVENGFSFDGLYGLCGFDLKKFKDVKRRFIAEVRKRYLKRY